MLMAGKKVTQAGDQLYAITTERIYAGLTSTAGHVYDLVQQLRTVKSMDPAAYRKAKTMLPYIVCAVFSPPVRRKENFAYTQCFMLDIDNLSTINMTPDGVKRLLATDERIALMFTSPGNDGVKALVLLSEKIYDPGYYSYFYKAFAHSFAAQYGLQGAVDQVTSDVSRCCFMSHDPETLFRPQAVAVNPLDYANPNILPEIPATTQTKTEKEKPEQESGNKKTQNPQAEIAPDILQQIKERMLPALAAKKANTQKEYIQPEELTAALPALTAYLQEYNMQLAAAKPISYGRQLKVCAGNLWTEINLFYGRAGFKTVKTTKTGSHTELGTIAKDAIDLFFQQQQTLPPNAPS